MWGEFEHTLHTPSTRLLGRRVDKVLRSAVPWIMTPLTGKDTQTTATRVSPRQPTQKSVAEPDENVGNA